MAEISTLNGYKIKDKKAIRFYNSIADMVADTTLKSGMHALTKGYYESGDNGHGVYTIVDDNTLTDDGGSIHELNNGLFAKLIYDQSIVINQFGAKNDGVTNNYNALSNALLFAINNNVHIKFLDGTYAYSGVITVPENQTGLTLIGSNQLKTIIKTLDNNSQIVFTNLLRSKVENIRFTSTGSETVPMISMPGVCHLTEFRKCSFMSNMGVDVGTSAYLKFEDCSFSRVSTNDNVNYLFRTKSEGSEYLYLKNCYFEGLSSEADCSPVQILGGHEIYIDDCDFCNWFGGNGLQLGGNASLKNVHISTSTFVRNNKAILFNTSKGVSNVFLKDLTFNLSSQNESKIIDIYRDVGQSGVLINIFGDITIDSSYSLSNKEMFTASISPKGGKIYVHSLNNNFPTANTEFFPICQPMLAFYNYQTINGSSTTVTTILTTNSPYKDINLPTLKSQRTNGTGPTDIQLVNTYGGNLEIQMTFASSSPWCQMYFDLKY